MKLLLLRMRIRPLVVFLSHLSGDEAHEPLFCRSVLFLSHLSGDEVTCGQVQAWMSFLSHLSGDEGMLEAHCN